MSAWLAPFINVLRDTAADVDTFPNIEQRARGVVKTVNAAASGQRIDGLARAGERDGLASLGHSDIHW
jgi:hypothetical protein